MPKHPIDQRKHNNVADDIMQQVMAGPEHDQMNQVFYNDHRMMGGFPQFYSKLRQVRQEQGLHPISQQMAKAYYVNQGVNQVFYPYTAPPRDWHTKHVSFHPFEKVYIDSMYLTQNNSVTAFCCIIDSFSKFAYAKMFTIRAGTSAIKSAQALQTFHEFIHEIQNIGGYNEQSIGMICADMGSEFQGDFKRYIEQQHLPLEYAAPADKSAMAVIERFHRTLRLFMEKWRYQYGRNNTNAVLADVLRSYNEMPHSGLPLSPLQILQGEDADREVISQINEQKAQENAATRNKHGQPLPAGTDARLYFKPEHFQRTGPLYSVNVHEVTGRRKGKYQVTGTNQLAQREWLQPIRYNRLMQGPDDPN